MIFFLVSRTACRDHEGCFEVLDVCEHDARSTDDRAIKLISWNEARYGGVAVGRLEDLKKAVIISAQKDPVCIEMNRRAFGRYGLYLFPPQECHPDKQNSVTDMEALIMRVLGEWAHPMIGNIANSPQVRPQTASSQMEKWNQLHFLDDDSKGRIRRLLDEPPDGLGRLQKSGHDQVRICWDMRTLARAFCGEITTLATRRLEKLFTLELCGSDFLYETQKALLIRLVTNIETIGCTAESQGYLLEQFAFSVRGKKGFEKEEYIKYFFPDCEKQEIEKQKIFYIALIEHAVGEAGLPGLDHPGGYDAALAEEPVKGWLAQWDLMPPVIRCAVIQNSLRKFMMGCRLLNRFRLAAEENRFSMREICGEDGRVISAGYCQAAAKVFPGLFLRTSLSLAWSWNRDEEHQTTQFYRKCLLPLWAGPSGHVHGNLDFVLSCLDEKAISVTIGEKTENVDAAAAALAGLFAFWRLYYDKRITGVHTIAETFDASIAGAKIRVNAATGKLEFEAGLVLDAPKTPITIAGQKEDSFKLLLSCTGADGVICPPLLMENLHQRYYPLNKELTADRRFQYLKELENQIRERLSAQYAIPLWSKPIVAAPELAESEFGATVLNQVNRSEILNRLRLFSKRNVHIWYQGIQRKFFKWPEDITGAAGAKSAEDAESGAEELQNLYRLLQQGDFSFANQYEHLPQTVNGTPVLERVILQSPKEIVLDQDTISFQANISMEASFWDRVRGLTGLGGFVPAGCCFLLAGGKIFFTADLTLCAPLVVTENFQLEIHSVRLQSGLDSAGYNLPQLSCTCMMGDFALTVSCGIDSPETILKGEFPQGEVFGLGDILKLAGLPVDLSVFPEGLAEEVFGGLGLRAFEASLCTETMDVQRMEFVISAQKPWALIEDKITLLPFLYLTFENPFHSKSRRTDLQIEGIWRLGTTDFHTLVRPESGEIQASLEEGEKLDTQAVQEWIGNVPLPDFSVSAMELCANFKTGAWSVLFETGKCLEFAVCGSRIEISDLKLNVEYSDGELGELVIAGQFTIGGIGMYLQGSYVSGDDWEFSASGAEETKVSFSAIWKRLKADIPALYGLEGVIPDDFLSFRIGKIYAGYSTAKKNFCLYLVLEQIKITESFVIESVLADVETGTKEQEDGGIQALRTLQLKAAFSVAGAVLELEIIRNQDGFRIHGGTAKEQELPVGQLLDRFAAEVLGYGVELPEVLLSFTINKLSFAYQKGSAQTGFSFLCGAGFGGGDPVLAAAFSAGAEIFLQGWKTETAGPLKEEWKYAFSICCKIQNGRGLILSVSYEYGAQDEQKKNCISLSCETKEKTDIITLYDILDSLGIKSQDCWSFLTQFGLKKAALSYDFSRKAVAGILETGNGGSLQIALDIGETSGYKIKMFTGISFSLDGLPVAGGIAGRMLPSADLFSVRDFNIYALSEPDETEQIPAGVRMRFTIFGETQELKIYEPALNQLTAEAGMLSAPKMYWKKLDRTAAVFTLHRLGIGTDRDSLVFALDASLNVRPFTVTLYGAGVGVSLSDYIPQFSLAGFGLSFQNEAISAGGSLERTGTGYKGALLLQVKTISVIAQIQYDTDGSLFAYAVINGNIGGAPAFFITGLALGFAWNKRIAVPEIEQVAESPLILAAIGKITPEELQIRLEEIMTPDPGVRVLTVGIRFTMFGIVDSFALLLIRFGSSFELDLLGTAEVSMLPDCPRNITPLAYAKLSLKAAIKPEEGFAGVEARLIPESYILSKDCRLTGGFAFYLWYQGAHSGDFVITLGGYHPKYETLKPAHYPDVPRVGFLWKIGNCVTIDGDMYFALTPSAVMAGGRLSAVYTLGPLKAYFVAKVDFYLSWKPFAYDASVGIAVGGSLQIKLFSVSITLRLELGAMLHIWGPDFSARARISIWILSFEIAFGANADPGKDALEWGEFCSAFLPEETPLKLSFVSGLTGKLKIGQKEYSTLKPDGVQIAAESVMPVHEAAVNGAVLPVAAPDTCVKPMKEKGSVFLSGLKVTVRYDPDGSSDDFAGSVTEKNLPTAVWGGERELICAPCGVFLTLREREYPVFPVNRFISLIDLYEKGATAIRNAYCFLHPGKLPDYTSKDTIRIFAGTVSESLVEKRRMEFLSGLGIVPEKTISLEKYAREAENFLDEEVLVAET